MPTLKHKVKIVKKKKKTCPSKYHHYHQNTQKLIQKSMLPSPEVCIRQNTGVALFGGNNRHTIRIPF